MSVASEPPRLLEEVADFLASQPSREALLAFHPSRAALQRAEELLERSTVGELNDEDSQELQQFEQAELLVRLIKARLRQADHE